MSKDIDHFIDTIIESIVLSIPIFFFAMSLWTQGFSLMINGEVQKIYLHPESYTAFIAQTALMIISLIFAIWSRMIQNIKHKKHLLYLTLMFYILSLIAFGILLYYLRLL